MKAIIMRGFEGDNTASIMTGYDLVVKITSLFGATVYPRTEELQNVVNRLGWRAAEFYPAVSFTFSPVTEPEIIILLRTTFKDIEIFTTTQLKTAFE